MAILKKSDSTFVAYLKQIFYYLKKTCYPFINHEERTKDRLGRKLGYPPNFKYPLTFNEKIQHRKFYDKSDYSMYTDKLAVRTFIAAIIGKEYLIPLLYVSDRVVEEEILALPLPFVIKANHDSGTVFVIYDYDDLYRKNVFLKLRLSLKRNYAFLTHEPWYSKIKPKVIVEQCLQDSLGKVPEDFKFHVFNEEIFLFVDYDRFGNRSRTIYDANFAVMPLSLSFPNKQFPLEATPVMKKMRDLAKELCRVGKFGYVRVDFYLLDNKIYFGELTFAHASGFDVFNPIIYDYQWGQLWH